MKYCMLHAEAHLGIFERLGGFGRFLDEVIFAGFIDTLKLVIFLFLTYLFMEFIEHKASDKAKSLMSQAGSFGPVIGGVFGAVPQCGFSAAAANTRCSMAIPKSISAAGVPSKRVQQVE